VVVSRRPAGASSASASPNSAAAFDLDPARTPGHVAVIMDGNGRWAEERGLSRSEGHAAGTENIRRVIEHCGERGIGTLTLFAFSTENWKRPRLEVRGLMHLLSRTIEREIQPLHEAGVRLRYVGRLDVLEPPIRRQVQRAVDLTAKNDKMTVCVAFNYGGRADIVDAVRELVAQDIAAEDVTEARIAEHLCTTGLPDPDLIIRTGGEQRLSNFLIWQAAYSEYHFTDTYWPDFGERDIDLALAAYAARDRRYGGLSTDGGD
jgi:undecaprenyl diphosphate synthase